MSERKDDYAVECFIRSYEKHPLNTADSAVADLLRELLELRAAVKTMREALEHVVANDKLFPLKALDMDGIRAALTGAHKDMTGGRS